MHRRLLATWCQPEQHPERAQWQARMVLLLAEGVRPCVPRLQVAGMTFAWCPPGSFLMGSPEDEEGRDADEARDQATVAKGFWMSVAPVMQELWQTVMGSNSGAIRGERLPVENVSWEGCRTFCVYLGQRSGQVFRLPTETEWEYACRAGTTTPFFHGNTINTGQVNYDGNCPLGPLRGGIYRQQTTAVGSFPANAWGLYDVHGNVWEWCDGDYGAYLPEAQ